MSSYKKTVIDLLNNEALLPEDKIALESIFLGTPKVGVDETQSA